jgi:hypothetical protein
MMTKTTVALLLISVSISAFLGCKNSKPASKNPIESGTANFNLSFVTEANQTQTFTAVMQASLLPKAVLDQFGGMADPGQPFNAFDIVNELPMQQLVVAAVSDQYCIVSYWQGGITVSFQTEIFELSGGSATPIWLSNGQGGLNFRDLKEMVESGRMHNDLRRPSLTPLGNAR